MVYRTWIPYNYRVVWDIDIYESVWSNQHIITDSYITNNAGIGPYSDSVSNHRDSSSSAGGIPADSYTMGHVYLLSEFCFAIDHDSSIMADNKPFPNIRVTF